MSAEKIKKLKSERTPEEVLKNVDHLPVAMLREVIRKKIRENENLVVVAETGSGKTTCLPPLLLELRNEMKLEGSVAVTQPRRVATRSVTARVADMMDCEVGGKVGYNIRFENVTKTNTDITFMTDGILLRKMQFDPLLHEYAIVMIDEAHERSLNIDLCLGLLKEVNERRVQSGIDPIYIVISSATIERNKFAQYLGGAVSENSIEIPGKMFPVQVSYESEIPWGYDFTKAAAENVNQILNPEYSTYWEINFVGNHFEEYPELGKNIQDLFNDPLINTKDFEKEAGLLIADYLSAKAKKEGFSLAVVQDQFHQLVWSHINSKMAGDILIFMPGKPEISDTIDHIKTLIGESLTEIIPLHAELPPEAQDRIFLPSAKRKIIVSTNIAETSVTIDGVVHVIDCGLIKQTHFNPATGIEQLVLVEHALSGLNQRKGRAGRTRPGFYRALYTKESLKNRPPYQTPEIQRSNVDQVILAMKKIGIKDIAGFNFIDHPGSRVIAEGLRSLTALGALDKNGDITEIGDFMSEMGLAPRLSRMVVEAIQPNVNCVNEICIIAAFLEGKNIFVRPTDELQQEAADRLHEKFKKDNDSDFVVILNVWNEYVKNNYDNEWAKKNYLNEKSLEEAKKVRLELLEILEKHGISVKQDAKAVINKNAIGKAITAGLLGNLMIYSRRFQLRKVDGRKNEISIHPASVLKNKSIKEGALIVSDEIFINPKGKAYACNCLEVRPEWIKEVAPEMAHDLLRSGDSHSKNSPRHLFDRSHHKRK